MSNIVFRKQASKGSVSQAHVKAFNEAPLKREEGLTSLKGQQRASKWAKSVAIDKINAQDAVNKIELENRNQNREAEVKERERIFGALQHNRRVDIKNIATEGENHLRMLDSIGKFIGAGATLGQAYQQKKRTENKW